MTSELAADFEKQYPRGPLIRAELSARTDAFSITVLFGPSGSGKTTILRCLAGLDRPTRGQIRFDSETWVDTDRGISLSPQERRIGFLGQDYALFPHLTVAGNIGFSLDGIPRSDRQPRIRDMIRMVELEGLENRYPRQLSGGQQQRVALARALARRPRLLFLDEPLSALDSPTREQLRRELRRWCAELRTPTLLVTHDRVEAMALGDRVVILDQGRVLQCGTADEVFNHPACVAAARIVGVETIEACRLVTVADGLATLEMGSTQMIAPSQGCAANHYYLCIRAQDVSLETRSGSQAGAANRLQARIQTIAHEGPMVRVGLDCGFPLTALVTSQSFLELGVEEGSNVTAMVKANAIHLIAKE